MCETCTSWKEQQWSQLWGFYLRERPLVLDLAQKSSMVGNGPGPASRPRSNRPPRRPRMRDLGHCGTVLSPGPTDSVNSLGLAHSPRGRAQISGHGVSLSNLPTRPEKERGRQRLMPPPSPPPAEREHRLAGTPPSAQRLRGLTAGHGERRTHWPETSPERPSSSALPGLMTFSRRPGMAYSPGRGWARPSTVPDIPLGTPPL